MSCPHCSGDKTSPEAIALGHQVPGVAVSLAVRKFALLTPTEGIEALLAWWEEARKSGRRARLTLDLVARPHEIELHIRPPATVFRRRRP